MSDNTEALRLATQLDDTESPRLHLCPHAAAELRRLHAENEVLREANEAFGKRQEWWNEKMVALEERNAELAEALREIATKDQFEAELDPHYTVRIARAALAKVQGETK